MSIYLPGRTGVATRHTDAQQVNWVSAAGDHAGEAGVGAFSDVRYAIRGGKVLFDAKAATSPSAP